MTSVTAPKVECERHHASLRVGDLAAAMEFYVTRLGFSPTFTWGDPPSMGGVDIGGAEMFLQQGTPAPEGCSVYFVIDDADALFAFHESTGVQVVEPIADRPYALRDYTVRDLDGHALTFGHRLQEREPPLPIERVDVRVRLERRLAAVLSDLAAHKRMSVGSCLEETLLHTFEPLGDGVASPHTRGDLRVIQQLKARHGLDYDCHASYRFVEQESGQGDPDSR